MWFIYAALAVLCFAGMQLLFKQLTVLQVPAAVLLLIVFALSTVLLFAHVRIAKNPIALGARELAFLAGAALFSYAGNLFMVRAIAQAPNPGYAMAIIGLQALPVLILSVFLFGSELTMVKGFGVLLSIAGVVLLMIDRGAASP